jgi:nicotinate phosphoribosyltransferase
MSLATLTLDAYQLTTLVAHADAGRIDDQLAMAFFFRKLPRQRNYIIFCGLRSILEHAAQMRLDGDELQALLDNPLLGPPLRQRPLVMSKLQEVDGFVGEIDALPEGTPAFAGPAWRSDGQAWHVDGAPVTIYTPLIQVRTDLLRAKLIETPWLGRINYMSMVASKAARVVAAAAGKPVLEFGARRAHPAAALDAAYAAFLAGCSATSNVAAMKCYGIPISGTMDHFYVQAAEHAGESPRQSERAAFAGFQRAFPDSAFMLVDTYDTEGGIREAVAASDGKLSGIRLDSNVTPETVARARALLDELGATHARILVSDGLDEWRVAALSGADGFGVGENISCVPDAAAGIGAVAKLTVNGYGKVTMKIARGTGKATLPGQLQVHRYADHDLVALEDEAVPSGGRALLQPVWRGRDLVAALPSLSQSREATRVAVTRLPAALQALESPPPPEQSNAPPPWPLVASDGLVATVERLMHDAAEENKPA